MHLISEEKNFIDRKEKKKTHTIIVGSFNFPLSITDRKSKQEIWKDTLDLNNTTSQSVLIDIYGVTENTGKPGLDH